MTAAAGSAGSFLRPKHNPNDVIGGGGGSGVNRKPAAQIELAQGRVNGIMGDVGPGVSRVDTVGSTPEYQTASFKRYFMIPSAKLTISTISTGCSRVIRTRLQPGGSFPFFIPRKTL